MNVEETIIDHESGLVLHEAVDEASLGTPHEQPQSDPNLYINTLLLALAKRVVDTDALAEEVKQLKENLKKMFDQMGHGKTWAAFTPAPRAVVSNVTVDDSGRELLNEDAVQEVLKLLPKE